MAYIDMLNQFVYRVIFLLSYDITSLIPSGILNYEVPKQSYYNFDDDTEILLFQKFPGIPAESTSESCPRKPNPHIQDRIKMPVSRLAIQRPPTPSPKYSAVPMLSYYWPTPHLQTPPTITASIGRWTKISALIQDALMKWCIILDIRFCKEISGCISLTWKSAAVRCKDAECRTRGVPHLRAE
jgi:hypothetical protein